MSLLCALAPSIGMLTATRILQGVAGAAVSVVVMAIVRDLFSGIRAAQLLSRLILVLGVAPILAPSLGSALLNLTSWRGIFVVLAVAAAGLWVLAWRALPETLPAYRRQPATVRGSLRSYRQLFRDGTFLVMVAVAGLSFATVFAYVAGARSSCRAATSSRRSSSGSPSAPTRSA
jgi:DHA1 family bicyclomycin/chloramphenicol resistance-like MFS transporter